MNAVYNLAARLNLARRFGPGALTDGELEQQAVQRLPQCRRSARALSKALCLAAAGAEGRLGLGRRARRAQPRLHQYRPVQRGMAAALLPVHRGQSRSRRSRSPRPSATRSIGGRPRQQTWYMAQFLLAVDKPDLLADAPGGKGYLTEDAAVLDRGKTLFAERCARCHSSKLPDQLEGMNGSASCAGARLSRLLEYLLEVDQDRRFQAAHGGDRQAAGFS